MKKNPLVNRQIRVKEVRVIDEAGKQLGIMDLEKAVQIAQEHNLDLIQVTEKVEPPVCKIMNYGRYLYRQKKQEKTTRQRSEEIKEIRLRPSISSHDLETKTRQAEKFLKRGNKIKIEMILRGREKALGNFAKEKIDKFLKTLDHKVEGELKRGPRGFTIIISKI